jgi:hypothetical protein
VHPSPPGYHPASYPCCRQEQARQGRRRGQASHRQPSASTGSRPALFMVVSRASVRATLLLTARTSSDSAEKLFGDVRVWSGVAGNTRVLEGSRRTCIAAACANSFCTSSLYLAGSSFLAAAALPGGAGAPSCVCDSQTCVSVCFFVGKERSGVHSQRRTAPRIYAHCVCVLSLHQRRARRVHAPCQSSASWQPAWCRLAPAPPARHHPSPGPRSPSHPPPRCPGTCGATHTAPKRSVSVLRTVKAFERAR